MTEKSPLSAASASSLEQFFAEKPPFSAQAMSAMIAEFRRMREKWQVEEREGKAKRAAKKVSTTRVTSTNSDIFGEDL
jgi:hypothetical protein